MVDRSIYLELDNVNVQEGGAVTVLGTLLEFSLNVNHKERKFVHVRVNRDLTYELRDSMKLISEFEDDINRGTNCSHSGEIVYYSTAGKNGRTEESASKINLEPSTTSGSTTWPTLRSERNWPGANPI